YLVLMLSCSAQLHASFLLVHTATSEIYTLSLHDALPISILIPGFVEMRRLAMGIGALSFGISGSGPSVFALAEAESIAVRVAGADRKSTRLNSSHVKISYAVFCLKKKKREHGDICIT